MRKHKPVIFLLFSENWWKRRRREKDITLETPSSLLLFYSSGFLKSLQMTPCAASPVSPHPATFFFFFSAGIRTGGGIFFWMPFPVQERIPFGAGELEN